MPFLPRRVFNIGSPEPEYILVDDGISYLSFTRDMPPISQLPVEALDSDWKVFFLS